MDFVYLIPEKMLHHLQQHPKTRKTFENIDRQKYNSMMVIIMGEIMQDKYLMYDHFSMIHISRDMSGAWMECFDKTLNEIELDRSIHNDLKLKMQKVLEEMIRPSEICKFLSTVIEESSSPKRLIEHIQQHLRELFKD